MMDSKKWIIGAALALIGALIIWGWQAGKSADTGGEGESTSGITAEDWVKGESNAPVTLVEYTDFQCPACAAYFPVVKELIEKNPDNLRVVIRHYPLIRIHPNALLAARSAEAAGRQGKFFEMHDILFSKQSEWATLADPKEVFTNYAKELGLNPETFQADLTSDSIDEKINRGLAMGDTDGVQGTPNFLLNGKRIENPPNAEAFQVLIDEAVGGEKAPPEEEKEKEVSSSGTPVHEHADFKVYIEGKPIDFTQSKYQSTPENDLNPDVHLHDGVGTVVHKHRSGITLGDFFKSLKMELTKGCLRLDTGEAYCSGPANTLKIWVNGQPSEKFDTFEWKDGDRILISYGSETTTALQAQMDSVTRDACIYSEKCPERGTPPAEECVGGLGTDCNKEGTE